jgi:hypothetical protein
VAGGKAAGVKVIACARVFLHPLTPCQKCQTFEQMHVLFVFQQSAMHGRDDFGLIGLAQRLRVNIFDK